MTTYVIVEKKSSEISSVWKAGHIILYVLCATMSFLLSHSIGTLIMGFEQNCILNTQLLFKQHNATEPVSCNIDNVQTKWSKNYADCNAHFMTYLLQFCASVTMATYFIFLNIGSRGSDSQTSLGSWRILWIATIINFVAFVASIVDAKSVVKAVLTVCRSFPDASLHKVFPCSTDCLIFDGKDQTYLSASFNILAISPWFSALIWGCNFGWCVIRILQHPDFSIYSVVFDEIGKEEESNPDVAISMSPGPSPSQ